MNDTEPLYLSAPVELAAAEGEEKTIRFRGTAYSGGVIRDYGFPIVVDLASTKGRTPMHILHEHSRSRNVGVATELSIGADVRVSGELFADIDPEAQAIAAKAQRGSPYEMSIGLFDYRARELEQGQSAQVNGKAVKGPAVVLSGGTIREVSIVALGADPRTSAKFFAERFRGLTEKPEDSMSDQGGQSADTNNHAAELSALTERVAQLSADLEAARKRAEDAEAALTDHKAEIRKGEVRKLFSALGRDYTDEAAKPYLEMSAEAFELLAKDVEGARGKAAGENPALFSEQANNGAGGNAPAAIDMNEIYASRREA